MYAKRIIPCLDVKNGRVVKGVSFVDLRDAGDPVECAAAYDKQGADELVLLDITATHEGRSTMRQCAIPSLLMMPRINSAVSALFALLMLKERMTAQAGRSILTAEEFQRA